MPSACGGLGGGEGRDLARVVGAVGEQDDDLRFARLVAQPVGAGGDGRADGGGVAGQADLEPVHVLQQPVVVEGERAHQIGLAGEDDHADAVVGPVLDELADRFAHHLDAADVLAVLVVIERLHRGRKIDGQHHVDAAFLHLRARSRPFAAAPARR